MSELDQFERSYCECQQCQATCKHMPGMLAPGDMDRMAYNRGVDMEDPDQSEAFIRDNFEASECVTAQVNGEVRQIPTIVPAQEKNGHCVFLSEDGRCTVHQAAPFGCSRFNVCDGPETFEESDGRSAACLKAICNSMDYMLTWEWLKKRGREAAPVLHRRRSLQREIGGF